MFLEAYLSRQEMIPYYECGDFPFNFGFIGLSEGIIANMVIDNITDMLDNLPEGKTANWVVGNQIIFGR